MGWLFSQPPNTRLAPWTSVRTCVLQGCPIGSRGNYSAAETGQMGVQYCQTYGRAILPYDRNVGIQGSGTFLRYQSSRISANTSVNTSVDTSVDTSVYC